MCVIVILFYTWRMINTKYFYWIGSRHILSVIPEIFQWWPCWPSPSTASLSSIFLQGLLDDGHPLLVSLSCGVSLEGAQLFCSKTRDPHVPVPLQDNLNKKDIYEIVNPNTATWTSRTSILFAFLCFASAQAWLTVCSMKSSAIWKFVEIVSLTRFETWRRTSSTSSSSCSAGSTSFTSSHSRFLSKTCKKMVTQFSHVSTRGNLSFWVEAHRVGRLTAAHRVDTCGQVVGQGSLVTMTMRMTMMMMTMPDNDHACWPAIPPADAAWLWLAGVPEAWLLILHSETGKQWQTLSWWWWWGWTW